MHILVVPNFPNFGFSARLTGSEFTVCSMILGPFKKCVRSERGECPRKCTKTYRERGGGSSECVRTHV